MREIILYFSLLYNGEFDLIFKAIRDHEKVDEEKFKELKKRMNCNYTTILDDEYPEHLKQINYPPFVLFYHGDLSLIHQKCFALVGMRQASSYGKSMALRISERVAKEKIVVVSGLAKGIDAYSHTGCLEAGGRSIAVLGCGINYCYPKENRMLYERMKLSDLVISEYPFDLLPRKDHFPKRNRIIVGLSQKLIVVESLRKGGSMISVGFALEQGKDVICVPQKFEVNDGCNYLVSIGARILVDLDDLFLD